MRLLDDPDDLELLGCGIPHSSSPPSAIMLFFSRRFSSVRSAKHSFSARASRRRSCTSPVVAARAVSPAQELGGATPGAGAEPVRRSPGACRALRGKRVPFSAENGGPRKMDPPGPPRVPPGLRGFGFQSRLPPQRPRKESQSCGLCC